ncbi:hypothetical protein pdam_00022080 [Pocillopora damicornis]|uniref:PLAT domain-containing protein n=1 Tax=Pocillopora damicornis TaxID=46731 RepID=A0A3M6UUN4_POCDA|nr:hypothetical protein pdam_00022080 [Pocillopora damicornis]
MSLHVMCLSLLYVYPFIHFLTAERDVDCRLLPTDKDISTEFRLQASGKRVKMVYLNLKIGNGSYHPLELADEFLPERWVWAKSIKEHMLSLPENYDVLSLRLLKYQVTSLDVHLADKPTGCVASLNSSSQNMAIGKMLLEYVTVETKNSSDLQSQVVCVRMIKVIKGAGDKYLEYQCCRISPNNLEFHQVLCDQTVSMSHWTELLETILTLIAIFLVLFFPAFPLALPDYIFSLQRECDKAEYRPTEDTGPHADRLHHTRNEYVEINQDDEEDDGIAVDDATPLTISTLLFQVVQRLPDSRFSFNLKLAFMLVFLCPLTIYVQLGLTLALNKRHVDETLRKKVDRDRKIYYYQIRLQGFVSATWHRPTRVFGEYRVLKRVTGVFTIGFLLTCSGVILRLTITLLTSSFIFFTNTVAYTTMGIALNANNVTPYAAFVLVIITNIYLCYANFQNRYKEVKGMISTCRRELHKNTGSFHSNVTIPTRLYWFVCSRVLPVKSEICRMLRNMAFILIFLFLVVYSIAFYGSENNVSAIFSVIAVVLTGVLPALLLKLLTEGKSFKGLERVSLERKIHSAVEQFYPESRNENTIISDRVNKQSTDVEQVIADTIVFTFIANGTYAKTPVRNP